MFNSQSVKMLVFLLFVCFTHIQSAKILGVFHMPSPSHYFLGNALMKELTEKGHDVTIISPFKEKNPPKNGVYREVIMEGFYDKFRDMLKKRNMFRDAETNVFLNMFFLKAMGDSACEEVLKNPGVQKLLEKDEFDVVIIEQFLNEAMKGFSYHFKAPLILLSTIGPNYWVNPLVGNPSPPSYIPEMLLNFSSNMTFLQRVQNSLFRVYEDLFYHFFVYPNQNQLMQKYFPNPPSLETIMYNISIVLLNSHSSFNQPVPLTPNMIEIGGFHVKPSKTLPLDLQQFLDNAKEGVIYFSLGSNLKSAEMSFDKRQAFLKAFSKLKQKVLWKWEEDTLPDQPPNVKVSNWLPQQEILGHPNLKLFITHGGLLSTIETIYHGVPILAIPIFGDQKMNAANAVKNGYGLTLPYLEISEETLSEKLREVLTNPKYKETAKVRSRMLHDQQVKPMDRAIFWVEYVIRNGGAPYFRVAALDLAWYQYLLLDVLAFTGLMAIGAVLGLCLIYKCCKRENNRKLKKS